MVAGSILPVCIHRGELLFLFGKENPLDDTPGWSCFGGGKKGDESPFDTACRESSEELTFFLGNKHDIRAMIKRAGGYYPITCNDYHIHVVLMEYNPFLVEYYNNNHVNLWKKMDQSYLKKTELFEKIEMKWFSPTEIKRDRLAFRSFYREYTDRILEEIPRIKKYIHKCKRNTRSRHHSKVTKRTTIKSKRSRKNQSN